MNRNVIDAFEAQADLPRQLMHGLSDDELDAKPGPGAWSMRELVVHLLDSDLVGAERMKRVIAMERPLLLGYDENAFVANLPHGALDLPLVCDVFAGNRRLMASLLRAIPDEAFARDGVHNEVGLETLEQLVATYVEHIDHHRKFAEQKRERLGKSAGAAVTDA